MQNHSPSSGRKRPFDSCLIIEDSTFDQERMRRILDRSFAGVRVDAVATLERARTYLETRRPDLILLDNNLPDGKGANFALEISANPALAAIPVIIVSDWPSPFMFDKAQTAGVQHIVSKGDFGARYIHAALAIKPKVRKAG